MAAYITSNELTPFGQLSWVADYFGEKDASVATAPIVAAAKAGGAVWAFDYLNDDGLIVYIDTVDDVQYPKMLKLDGGTVTASSVDADIIAELRLWLGPEAITYEILAGAMKKFPLALTPGWLAGTDIPS